MHTTDRRNGSDRTGERGAAAVEFALVAPLLVLLICGIIDLGRAYATLNQLAAAAREGARVAAVLPDPEGAQLGRVRDAVAGFAKGQLAGPDIARSSIDVDLRGDSTVTVTVQNYPFKLITPLASLIKTDATIHVTRRATFRWERAALPPAS
jgi:Flp pilus assembly protein TadG